MRVVFFDIETGGLRWWEHKINGISTTMNPIIQIAAAAYSLETCQELEVFERKIIFREECADPEALAMNCYDSKVWAQTAIHPVVACDEFTEFLKMNADVAKISKSGNSYNVAQLVGHNAAGFDAPFLREWFKALKRFYPAEFHVLDTLNFAALLRFSGLISPPDLKLTSLCAYLDVPLPCPHDALSDVRATAACFFKMIALLKTNSNTNMDIISMHLSTHD